MVDPLRGPVGHQQHQIIIIAVAAPGREPQVVADLQTDPPVPVIDNDPGLTCRVAFVFSAEGKQVAFIVIMKAPFRRDKNQTIVALSVFHDNSRTGNRRIEFLSQILHPCHRGTLHIFNRKIAVSEETRGESFGQYQQIERFV